MCGGIVYNIDRIPKEELHKFYTLDQIRLFKKRGLISSFFWDKRPLLPAKVDGKVTLFDWGNRDKNNKLPQTGWAKEESILHKRWDYLNPKKITIPATRGYEKGKWFEFESDIDGLLVQKGNDKKVYMITKKADKKYLDETHHERMPKAKINQYITNNKNINEKTK